MILSIFTSLMNKRATHIFRSITITFLMAGFLAHLLVPFSSQAQKTAFTRWLDHNVVSSGNESEVKLRNTIKELPEQAGDFWILVEEASELVANHRDHFKIPVSSDTHTQNQSQSGWLIEQWNMFQNQKSGFNSVLVESLKVLPNWIPQTLDVSGITNHSNQHQVIPQNEVFYSFAVILGENLQPLISGISINAP